MKHYGDITKLNGHELPIVDIITGGSPCQDLSVAGKRAGLAGERSGLFMDQIRIIKEMRDECAKQLQMRGADEPIRPRFMVWENVPGAFSSNKGEDFRAVLEETARVVDQNAVIPRLAEKQRWSPSGCIMGDGWSIAWRLHDAQFWGVPQRRKRIALVADFGGASAPEILFERKGLSGDFEKSGETGKTVAGDAAKSIGKTGGAAYTLKIQGGADTYVKSDGSIGTAGKGPLVQTELSGTLGVSQDQTLFAFEPGAASRVGGHVYDDDKAGTVRANAGDNQQAVVYGISAYESNSMKSDNPHSGIYEAETARTLDLNGGSPACNQGGMAVVCYDRFDERRNGPKEVGDMSPTITEACGTSGNNTPIVIEGNGSRPSHRGDGYVESETMYTLNSTEHHAVAYRKQGHPQNAEQGQGREQTDVNDTLNAFDSGEARTPTVVVEGFDSYNLQPTGDVGRTLTTPGGGLNEHMPVVLENHPADSRVKVSEDGIVQTLSSRMGTGGGNVPMIVEPSSWDGSQISPTLTANNANGSQRMPDKDNFNAVLSVETYQNTTGSLCASGYDKLGTQEAANDMYVVQSMEVFHCTSEEEKVQTLKARDYKDPQIVSYGVDSYNQNASEEMVEPLRSAEGGDTKPKVCTYGLDRASFNQGANAKYDFSIEEEIVGAQVARGPGAVLPWMGESVVRRLTPLECTRLQGFPDGWVDIGDWTDSNGKLHKDADSPKYKALGNSIALPFWRWMAKRMRSEYDLNQHVMMASLFDGIGGFPLSFSEAGITPVWASEIEEFPMAVTQLRFPE